MTIHADFFKIVKENCGDAFSTNAPMLPDVVFIDGQVKLMKADAVNTWELFFCVQFFKTIEKSFAMGAQTVVLAFDDYEHVPASKAMTQAKRAKQRVNYDFAQTCCLPARPPEDWGSAMANRTFKVKVVCKVLEVTKAWFESKLKHDPQYATYTLVLDHRGVPVVLEPAGSSVVSNFVENQEWSKKEACIGRGECDIKAFSWMPIAKCLCIVSVDGDYLPLSLLQTRNSEQANDFRNCKVLLYRMLTRAQPSMAGKRKSSAEDTELLPCVSARRQYEFVNIAPISVWLRQVFPSKAVDPVIQFCSMVALCGCDFARNLPRLGPRSLWKIRHRLQNSDLSQPTQALSALCLAYHDMFIGKNTIPQRVANNPAWFQQASESTALSIYEDIAQKIAHSQRVSQRIKEQIWPAHTSRAHTLNASWTMLYWSLLERAPDPHTEDFGYVRDQRGRTSFAVAPAHC